MLNSYTSEAIFRSWNVLQNTVFGLQNIKLEAYLWRRSSSGRAASFSSFHRSQFVPHRSGLSAPPGNQLIPHQRLRPPGNITIIKREQHLLKEWQVTNRWYHTPVPSSHQQYGTYGNGTQPVRNPETAPLCNVRTYLVTTSLVSNCPCRTAHWQNHPIPASHIYRSGYHLHGWPPPKRKKGLLKQ